MDLIPLGKKDTYMMDKTNPHLGSVHFANLSDLRNHLLKSIRKEADDDKESQWINIEERSVIKLILETYVDPEKNKILNLTAEKALAVPELLDICEIPTTSGYRTINSLIENGLLTKSSSGSLKNGRKINRYRSIFENVKINIEKDKVSVYAKFAKV